jgi:hypothetical protein
MKTLYGKVARHPGPGWTGAMVGLEIGARVAAGTCGAGVAGMGCGAGVIAGMTCGAGVVVGTMTCGAGVAGTVCGGGVLVGTIPVGRVGAGVGPSVGVEQVWFTAPLGGYSQEHDLSPPFGGTNVVELPVTWQKIALAVRIWQYSQEDVGMFEPVHMQP